jgi:predicted metal-dependent phosphotriesterase family hydrolase
MQRKDFLKISAGLFCATFIQPRLLLAATRDFIYSVNGRLNGNRWGTILAHEHILVDFGGAEVAGYHRYDRQKVIEKALPHLLQFKKLGGNTLFECTPAYLGRDPFVMKELSEKTGINIIVNTGYYGARNHQHLPPHTFTDTPEQLAHRWTEEFRNGIEDSDIRPGFIKIGVNRGSLSEPDKKLIRAACITHLETGLTIASHTGPAEGALEQLDILKQYKVHPSAFIWVHAQNENDLKKQEEIARLGAWIGLDGISEKSLERHFSMLNNLRKAGFLSRVLISHDSGWYRVGEEDGGNFQPFSFIFEKFIPLLKREGYSKKEVNMLMRDNPVRAYAIKVRRVGIRFY